MALILPPVFLVLKVTVHVLYKLRPGLSTLTTVDGGCSDSTCSVAVPHQGGGADPEAVLVAGGQTLGVVCQSVRG